MESDAGANPATPLTARQVGDHYDQFAWAYRRYWGDHIHHGFFTAGGEEPAEAQEVMLRHCAARAAVQPGMRVADVGCGHGGTAAFLAREYSCHIFGLTISQAQLDLARKACERWNGAVQFVLADAESYEFPTGNFDLVWNMESSEHFLDKAAYFKKIKVSLKPGGRLMLAAWSGSMRDPLVREVARIFLCPQLWTVAEYVDAIEAAGMKVLSCEQLAAEVARTWDIAAEQARKLKWLLPTLPSQFSEFVQGIELMREGYRNGQLKYAIIAANRD
jgi:tocopherol O-methyltransferase